MTDTDLVFGWRTALLTVAIIQLLLIAGALARTFANRSANRILAVLLVVLAGIVTPWAIGFAGFYDRWRWLTFVPVTVPLAVAPLLYLYVATLVRGRVPPRAWLHFVAAGLQFLFLAVSFLLPMPAKNAWADLVGAAFNRVAALGTVIGLVGYGVAGLRLLRRYRINLADQRSDDQRYAARWLGRAIVASFVLLPVWAGYELWDWLNPLGYRGLMGLYVAIAAFALYLAIEGWRHAALPYPALIASGPDASVPGRDWTGQGQAWAAKVRAERWHLDPDLSLPELARRLGTNTGHLSRAVNEGLGVNFSTFVNGLRSEEVAASLRAGATEDLLTLAHDAGFSSKASFNRAFRAAHGVSPSTYRARVSKPE